VQHDCLLGQWHWHSVQLWQQVIVKPYTWPALHWQWQWRSLATDVGLRTLRPLPGHCTNSSAELVPHVLTTALQSVCVSVRGDNAHATANFKVVPIFLLEINIFCTDASAPSRVVTCGGALRIACRFVQGVRFVVPLITSAVAGCDGGRGSVCD